jgi:hypothetical protein
VSVLRPRAGLSPFRAFEPLKYDFELSPESEGKTRVVSPESGTSSDGAGYVFDDLADVDLGVDWSGQVSGFTPAVQEIPTKSLEADVLELADDYLEFEGNLDLNLDFNEYSLG